MHVGDTFVSSRNYASLISWQTERDLELLDGVWTMLGEWTAHMDTWKFGKFREIDVGACQLMTIR